MLGGRQNAEGWGEGSAEADQAGRTAAAGGEEQGLGLLLGHAAGGVLDLDAGSSLGCVSASGGRSGFIYPIETPGGATAACLDFQNQEIALEPWLKPWVIGGISLPGLRMFLGSKAGFEARASHPIPHGSCSGADAATFIAPMPCSALIEPPNSFSQCRAPSAAPHPIGRGKQDRRPRLGELKLKCRLPSPR